MILREKNIKKYYKRMKKKIEKRLTYVGIWFACGFGIFLFTIISVFEALGMLPILLVFLTFFEIPPRFQRLKKFLFSENF